MTSNKTRKKILLAEDDKFISRAYQDGLTRAGFAVEVASDGQQALESLKQNKADLVLLDIIMPDKNGFETLEEIKADENLRDIPVIILSNLGQNSDIAEGKRLGAEDYLIKSNFSINEVIEKIEKYIK